MTSVIYSTNAEDLSELTYEQLEGIVAFKLNKDSCEDKKFYKSLPYRYKNKAHLYSDDNYIFEMEQLWNKWQELCEKIPLSSNFLFFHRKINDQNLECKDFEIYFVNVFNTSMVLQENYSLFREFFGSDFDPLKEALNFGKTEFWNVLIENGQSCSYLWGLLFGFGKQNSFGYHWKWSNLLNPKASKEKKNFSKSLTKKVADVDFSSRSKKSKYTISEFPIPSFASFSENDPVVKKYEKERGQIQKIYLGRDFVDTTLEFLTKNDEAVYFLNE